jgi:hypothetical protein
MRNAITFAALVVLLTVPAGTAAAASRGTSDAAAVVDARHANLLNRAPVVDTDARHAALVVRAGARPRIAQPNIAGDLDQAMRGRNSTVQGGVAWIGAGIGAGTALLILGGAAILLTRRRKPLVA